MFEIAQAAWVLSKSFIEKSPRPGFGAVAFWR
jgi:hypothetical protein